MAQWYYKLGPEEKGPVSQEELAGMVHRKEIGPKTLVRGGAVKEWTPIDELEDLKEPLLDVRSEEGKVALEEAREVEEAPKVRPWVRFVGRMFDYCWFGIVLTFVLEMVGLSLTANPFGILLIPFLWVFAEAMFLSTWGETPGKWLTQTSVRCANGQKLSFRDAIYRSFSVWWIGMGAGIFIVSLVTMIVACVKLSNNRITTWDKSGKFAVRHHTMGPLRIIVLIAFFAVIIWMLFPTVTYGN